MATLPIIDVVYLRHVFDTLAQMSVSLDSDPLVFGPKRLNAKVALCREHLSKCQQIYLQLADDLHQLSRAHRQAKLEFDLQMQDLLANDPDVRSQRNIRDREAVGSSKLRAELEAIFRIETSRTDLESVITVVKAKREDLKDIQGRIRDQVKLCQEEIGLGLKWGSAPPPGAYIDLESRPRVDPGLLDEYNDVLGGLDGESSITDLANFVRSETGDVTPPPPVVATAPPVVATAPPVVVTAPPVVATAPPAAETDFDLDDLLADTEAAPVQITTVVPEPEPVQITTVEPEPVVEAPAFTALPEVTVSALPLAASSSTSASDVDDFFNELILDPEQSPAQGSASTPATASQGLSSDENIDDLLSSFG